MTSFVHVNYPTQHAGADRLESAVETVQQIRRTLFTTQSLALLLLSAIAAAVLAVVYQVMDSMADGHLLALWMGMWAVAFAALAVFASTARQAVLKTKTSLDSWSRSIAAKRADERLWAMAKNDVRLMSDLQAVMARRHGNDEGLRFVAPASKVGKRAQQPVVPPATPLAAYHRLYI